MFEPLFQLSSLLVMPFWLLMIFLPRWRWTQRSMGSPWVVAPIALLYAVLIGPQMASALPLLFRPTLSGIAALLGTPVGATIGWLHFLAFDLFVGRWAYLESRRHGMSAWLVSPILFVVLMFGPLGLLLFLALRTLLTPRSADPATGTATA